MKNNTVSYVIKLSDTNDKNNPDLNDLKTKLEERDMTVNHLYELKQLVVSSDHESWKKAFEEIENLHKDFDIESNEIL